MAVCEPKQSWDLTGQLVGGTGSQGCGAHVLASNMRNTDCSTQATRTQPGTENKASPSWVFVLSLLDPQGLPGVADLAPPACRCPSYCCVWLFSGGWGGGGVQAGAGEAMQQVLRVQARASECSRRPSGACTPQFSSSLFNYFLSPSSADPGVALDTQRGADDIGFWTLQFGEGQSASTQLTD